MKKNQMLTECHPFVPFVNPLFEIELAAIWMCGITRGSEKVCPCRGGAASHFDNMACTRTRGPHGGVDLAILGDGHSDSG